MDLECKIIKNPSVARNLLKLGNRIVDIKADKRNKLKTVFVFEKNSKFEQDLEKILSNE